MANKKVGWRTELLRKYRADKQAGKTGNMSYRNYLDYQATGSYRPTMQIGNKTVKLPEINKDTDIDEYNKGVQNAYQNFIKSNPLLSAQYEIGKLQAEGNPENNDRLAKLQSFLAANSNKAQYGKQHDELNKQAEDTKNRIQDLNTQINESQRLDMNSESGLTSQKTQDLIKQRDELQSQYDSTVSQRDEIGSYLNQDNLYSYFLNKANTDSMNADKDKDYYVQQGIKANEYEQRIASGDLAGIVTSGKTFDVSNYTLMSDDEKEQYNYRLGRYGKEDADKYLATTSFRYNNANYINDQLEQYGDLGNAGKIGLAIAAGVGDFVTGIENIPYAITDDEGLKVENSILQDIADVSAQRAGNDMNPLYMGITAGRAGGRMLPSMAIGQGLGALGMSGEAASTVGSAIDSVSMFGGTYKDIRGEGSSREESLLYAGTQAGMEFATEKFLGTIPGLRGTGATNVFEKMTSKLDDMLIGSAKLSPQASRLASAALRIGVSGAEEGAEEYVSAVFDPVVRNVIYNENNEFEFWNDDIAEQVAVGALLGTVMNSTQVASNTYTTRNAGGKVIAEGKIDDLIESGLAYNKDTLAFRVANNIQSRIEAGENPSASDIGMLQTYVEMQMSDNDKLESYLSGNEDAWKDLNYDMKKAILNPDNIAEFNERFDLNIPENASPMQIAEYLKAESKSVMENKVTSWQESAKANGVDSKVSEIVTNAIRKSGLDVAVMDKANIPKTADGEEANGYITEDGKIYVNPNLSDMEMLNTIVKHEITHAFEGTKEYDKYKAKAIENIESQFNIEAIKQGIREDYAKIYSAEQGRTITPEEISDEIVESEMVAKYTETLFTDIDEVAKLYKEDKNLFSKIYNAIKSLIKTYGGKGNKAAQIYQAERLFKQVIDSNAEINTFGENVKFDYKGKSKLAGQITINTSEKNRETILKKSKIEITNVTNESNISIKEIESMFEAEKQKGNSDIDAQKKVFRNIMPENKEFNNPYIKSTFMFSGKKSDESVKHQSSKYNSVKEFEDLALVYKNLHSVVENAIPIEVHKDNYAETKRSDKNLINTYALLSAISKGNDIVPVIVIVKNGKIDKTLHMIKTGKKISGLLGNPDGEINIPATASNNSDTISIPDLVELINKKDGGILKYLPSGMLTEEQKENADRANQKGKTKVDSYKYSSGRSLEEMDAEAEETHDNIIKSHNFVNFFGDWQNNPNDASKVVNEDGTPKVLYHQTNADIRIFDTSIEGAGRYDELTPNGIFMKPTDDDIQVSGKKQIPLYVNIRKPLTFKNRWEMQKYWEKNISGYSEIVNNIKSNDIKYEQMRSDAEKEGFAILEKVGRKAFLEMSKEEQQALYDDALKKEESVIEKWSNENNSLSAKAKALINDYIKSSNFDGIHLISDEGSFGRTIETWIALESNQVKHATDNLGTFNPNNPDIRYSQGRSLEDISKEAKEKNVEMSGSAADIISQFNNIGAVPNVNGKIVDDLARRVFEERGMNVPVTPKNVSKVKEGTKRITVKTQLDDFTQETKDYASKNANKEIKKVFNVMPQADGSTRADMMLLAAQIVNIEVDAYDKMKNMSKAEADAFMSKVYADENRLVRETYDNVWSNTKNGYEKVSESDKKYLNKTLRTKLYVPETVAAEFGDDFRWNMSGLNLTKRTDVSALQIDDFYSELSNEHPELFPSDIETEQQMLEQILRVKEEINTPNLVTAGFEEGYDVACKTAFNDFATSMRNIARRSAEINGTGIPEIAKEQVANNNYEVMFDYDDMTMAEMRAKQKVITRIVNNMKNSYSIAQHELDYAIKLAESRIRLDDIPADVNQKVVQDVADAYKSRFATQLQIEKRRVLTNQAFNALKRLKSQLSKNKSLSQADRDIITNILSQHDIISKSLSADKKIQIANLKQQYIDLALKNGDVPDFESLPRGLQEKFHRLDAIQVDNMTLDELEGLMFEITSIEHSIGNMNNTLTEMYNTQINEIAADLMDAVYSTKEQSNNGFARAFDSLYKNGALRPKTYFLHLTGHNAIGEHMFNLLNDAEIKKETFKQEAYQLFKGYIDENDAFMKKISGKKAEFITVNIDGKEYQITPAMRMSLYMHSLNADNKRHFAEGYSEITDANGNIKIEKLRGQGITIPDAKLYKKGKIGEAYKKGKTVSMDDATLKQIVSQMPKEEIEFCERAKQYFDVMSKDAINETSMLMDGVERANVENYFPIQTDPRYLGGNKNADAKAMEEALQKMNPENMGSLKERKSARNPIMLTDITQVILQSIDSTAEYVGLAPALRDFDMIWSAKTPAKNYVGNANEKNQIAYTSVEQAVEGHKGGMAVKYINDLRADLVGGRRNKSAASHAYNVIAGNFAQAALSGNWGVVFKQAASYQAAGAIVGEKALAKGFNRKVDEAIIDKYTPLLALRRKGAGVKEIGDIMENHPTWAQKVPHLMQMINKMDIATVKKLWGAAEVYVEDTLGMVKADDEDAFYKATAEVYNKIIQETQPNYSVMQRSAVLRSKNPIVKALTVFNTQRNQNYNILFEAGERYAIYKQKFKNGEITEAEMKEAGKGLFNAVSSQIGSAMIVAGINLLVKAFKGGFDDEDDDGEIWDDIMQKFFMDSLSTGAGNVFGGAELFEIISNKVNGKDWDGLSVPALDQINGLTDSISQFMDAVSNLGDADENDRELIRAARGLGKSVAMFFGIPAENFEGYGLALADNIGKLVSGLTGEEYSIKDQYYNYFYPTDVADVIEAVRKDKGNIHQTVNNIFDNGMANVKDTEAGAEIERLAGMYVDDEEGHNIHSLFTKSAPDTIVAGNHTFILTKEAKNKYLDTQNIYLAGLDDYVKSEEYKKLDDDQKFTAIANYIGYAEYMAKAEYLSGNKVLSSEDSEGKSEKDIKKVEEFNLKMYDSPYYKIAEADVDINNYITYSALTKGVSKEKDKAEIISNMGLDEQNQKGIFGTFINDNIYEASDEGVSADTFIKHYTTDFTEIADKQGVSKGVAERNWMLENIKSDNELASAYSYYCESDDLQSNKTMSYAVSQNISPRRVIEFDIMKESAEGEVSGTSDWYTLTEDGVQTSTSDKIKNNSKKYEVFKGMIDGGFNETEMSFFINRDYDNKEFIFNTQAGVSASDYAGFFCDVYELKSNKDLTSKERTALMKQAVNKYNCPAVVKKIMYMSIADYSLSKADYSDIIGYIKTLPLSAAEKYTLAENIGLKVKDGKVYPQKK